VPSQLEETQDQLALVRKENRELRKTTPKTVGPLAQQAIFAACSMTAGALDRGVEHAFPDVPKGLINGMIGTCATTAGMFIQDPDARAIVDSVAKAYTGPAIYALGYGATDMVLKRLEDVAAGKAPRK
jgi:hypothetical protein